MNRDDLLTRIGSDPTVMVGKPCIRGTRLTVHYILGLLASGATFDEILSEYDGLAREDILAVLAFAARALEDTAFVPLVASTA